MRYFSLEELCASSTADRLGIDNTPTEEVIEHLVELIYTLDTIRKEWGSPIRVNSGYRCHSLNKAVGGASSSAHLYGYAADLYPVNGNFNGFVDFMKKWARTHHFDQILVETNSKGGRWIHIGLYNGKHNQRHQIKNLNVK